MATYRIENDEIHISFNGIPSVEIRNDMKSQAFRWDPNRKVWHAPHTQEQEELASKIAPAETVVPNEPTASSPLLEGVTLDEKLERLLSSNDKAEKAGINNALTQGIESDLDAYVQAIRDYKKDEEDATSEKKAQEASIKDSLDAIAAKKKLASDKRKYLEHIIVDYLLSTGEEKLAGGLFNVSFKEVPVYSISAELEEEILRRANLPSWISMELKINQKAFKELAEIPEGAVESSSYKFQSWTEQEGDPNIPSYQASLDAFLGGESIRDIADRRNLKWGTVKNHLMKAIDEGLLDIHQYVPGTVLNELEALGEHSEQWKITDFRNAIHNQISYDWTSLALSFLKIWSLD